MFAPVLLSIFVVAQPAQKPGYALPNTYPDPGICQVVLDDMGNVGLRISDAQQLAETTVTAMVKRVGHGGIIYEGLEKNAKKMKSMLGPNAETQIQDDQLEYYRRAKKAAGYRLRVRFKKRKGKHHITLSCRKADAKPKDVIEKKVFVAKRFRDARQKLADGLPTFCPSIIGKTPAPGGTAGQKEAPNVSGSEKARRKRLKKWAPPPPRK